MKDPRLNIIDRRLEDIKKIVAVSGGKGGVGKSSVASLLSLVLSERNCNVGLLDLDFHGPTCHVILGADIEKFPEEHRGITPPEVFEIKFMSIVYYAKDNPAVFRGADVTNSIIELLSVVIWKELDYLIIDIPPGLGEGTLDTIKLIKGIEFLLVTVPSRLAFNVLSKEVRLLKETKIPVSGVIENMSNTGKISFKKDIKKLKVPYLGQIDRDKILEENIGNPAGLKKTAFARDLNSIIDNSGFKL
ncbi:MAG: P-loop NTPase [Elusimicrobiota bacterium]